MEFEIKRKNALQSVLVYIIVMYLVSSLLGSLFGLIIKQTGTNLTEGLANTLNGILQLLIYAILFVGLFLINRHDMFDEAKGLKDKNYNTVYRIIAGFGIFYLINILCNTLTTSIDSYASFYNNILGLHKNFGVVSENQSQIEDMMHSGGAFFMFVSAVLVGPICEELVFRKSFFNLTKSDEINLLLSSFFFGMIHLFSSIGTYSFVEIYTMAASYIASGLALGYIYLKNNKNIWIPIAVHMLSNLISMIAILFVK